MNRYIEMILFFSLSLSVFGYLFAVIKEKLDLKNQRVSIKSKSVTQDLIDDVDFKVFKLGEKRLNIGDEISVKLKNDNKVKGTLIGAKKVENALCIVTDDDQLLDVHVTRIKKLKVTLKYGRLF
ncbi:hypothetical protein [Fusibacter sp. JL216-2]|uniref:hypothetical protein n=1 Tax=Fusibacter sp. JL216-2 TaxID=3071453 RepID=UPI003D332E14